MRTSNFKLWTVFALSMALSAIAANAAFTFSHVGAGVTAGTSFTPNAEPGSYTLVGGGNDIWDTTDEFDFAYVEITGDFDISARLDSVEVTAKWTKAGIMARESLDPGSRMAFSKVTPSGPTKNNCPANTTGQGDVSFMYRTWFPGAGPTGGQHEDRLAQPDPQYPPYLWLRLQRVGNLVRGYASTNGIDWSNPVTQDTAAWLVPTNGVPTPLAQTLLLGMAVSRHGSACADVTCAAVYSKVNPALVRDPQSLTLFEARRAEFSVGLNGIADWRYQWLDAGNPIVGATNATYTIAAVAPSDNNKHFSVRVTDALTSQTFTSGAATLTVLSDTDPPTLASVSADTSFTHVTVVFSETITQASAERTANYAINGGVSVLGAALQPDNMTVVLTTSELPQGQEFTITINGITDRAVAANQIAANTTATFGTLRWAPGLVLREFYFTIRDGSLDFDPVNPDYACYTNLWELNASDTADHYRSRMTGFYVADETGLHTFFVASDDNSNLYLSTDENPANKVLIARDPAWANRREYTGSGPDGNRGTPPPNVSVPIELIAGQRYYMETRHNEGTGGDHIAVAVQKPSAAGPPLNGSSPITEANLGSYIDVLGTVIAFTQQPANATIEQNGFATFTAAFNITSPRCGPRQLQWLSNDVAIAGANGPSYTFGPASLDADQSQFKLRVTYVGVSAFSAAAQLTVVADVTPPTVVKVTAPASFDSVLVQFSELIQPGASEDPVAYGILDSGRNGLNIDTATLQPDGKSVKLALNPATLLLPSSTYTLQVSRENIMDLVGNSYAGGDVTFQTMVEGCPGVLLFSTYNTPDTETINATAVSSLVNSTNFPNSPREPQPYRLTEFTTRQAYPDDSHEHYGGWIRGLFVPPASGNWIFYVHSDDASQLWLNPNGPSPSGKVLIAEETGCCNDFPTIHSGPIALEGGNIYYIEGLYKEGGGGDYMRVAARLESDTTSALVPLGADKLGQFANPGIAGIVGILQQPANLSVQENTVASFSIVTSNQMNLSTCYQWQRSADAGVTWENIDGAAGPTYSFVATLADSGRQFRVLTSIIGDKRASAAAILTVTADITPPSIASIKSSPDLSIIYVTFSELMDLSTIQDAPNYGVSDSAFGIYTVDSALLLADGKTVKLKISPALPPGIIASVDVQNVFDKASTPNAIQQASVDFLTFRLTRGLLTFESFNTGGGTSIDLLTNHATYPDNPRERLYMTAFNTRTVYPDDTHDNYGARVRGFFIPPASGNWVFFTRSDDASQLWMNTNAIDSANPDGKVLIAQEIGCCAGFMAVGAPQTSQPIPLEASRPYYIEGLLKEGGGGDYLQVAARLDGQGVPGNGEYLSSTTIATYADPSGNPQITVANEPANTAGCYIVGEAAPMVQICVGASASRAGIPETAYYQWQKNSGAGFVDILGANASCYSYVPPLSDNGVSFRALIMVPGGPRVTTETATLTVLQANTPPQFTKGADQEIDQNAPAQAIPNWASAIQVHSISRAPLVYQSSFDSLPPGARVAGTARVNSGLLKITDAVNSSNGAFYTPPDPLTAEAFNISFDMYIGGGTCCGATTADGMSVNIGNNLPDNPPAGWEDGLDASLSVNFDTWDNSNGGGEAPAITVEWNGAEIARAAIDVALDNAPIEFRPVTVSVDSNGIANVFYNNQHIFTDVQIPGYVPQSNVRAVFGARTGGANDNQWVDNLRIEVFHPDASVLELSQSVQFVVSNDNPGLFSVQPAISPDGTLTYTPAPHTYGTALVSVALRDDGGTACGGNDTSPEQTFVIAINGGIGQPTLDPINSVVLNQGAGQQTINLTGISRGTNVSQAMVLTAVSSNPALVPNPTVNYVSPNATGTLTFTPSAGTGVALITVTAQVGQNSVIRTFSVTVNAGPEPGTPDLHIVRISPTSLELSWPTNNASGYKLQACPVLPPAGVFADVVTTPQVRGNSHVVTETLAGPSQFYRLLRP